MSLARLLALSYVSSGLGAVLQVAVGGADTGSCTSAACATIKYAISQASTGDTIQLSAGTFTGEGNRNIAIGIEQAVDPQDLKIESVSGPEQTIIDIQKSGRGFRLGLHAGAVSIKGITLTNGLCAPLNATDDVKGINGAGVHLVNSKATLRNIRLTNMLCTKPDGGVEYGQWSGAAIYLRDSTALIDGIEVIDAKANHGGGVAAFGNDNSQILNSVFLRGVGTAWGGCMLMEDNVSTLFDNVRFSYSGCSYGAALDDGTDAHPTYRNCIFEYGIAIHGGAIYHYGKSYVTFENCVFQHNHQNSGTIYLNADTRPTIRDCLFYNNTADSESTAIRSFYTGAMGPVVVERTRFVSNHAEVLAGAVSCEGNFIFRDCEFDSNFAGLKGAAMIVFSSSRTGTTTLLHKVTFKNNVADGNGGAITIAAGQTPATSTFTLEDCTFENNRAKNGGAISVEFGLDLRILGSRFVDNVATANGGSLYLSSFLAGQPLLVTINDTVIEKSSSASGGGAISCKEMLLEATTLEMNRFTIRESKTFLNGGGLEFDCSKLKLRQGAFENNRATEGNGGAMVLSQTLQCAKGHGTFAEVQFHNNGAANGGGLVYFDHLAPECRLPLLADGISWNSSSSSVWSWNNFDTAVQGNDAFYGNLQATAPSQIILKCALNDGICSTMLHGQKVKIDGFSGVELQLEASLQDDFGSRIVSPGMLIEVALDEQTQANSVFSLRGTRVRPLEAGTAHISGLFLIGDAGSGNNTIPVIVRIPRGFASLQAVKMASMDVKIDLCTEGFYKGTDALSGATECIKCPSGKFSYRDSDACIACDAGKYASASGSAVCSVCALGHGCPAGTTEPAPCNAGFYQALNGSAECFRCSKGSYQEALGQSACVICPGSQSTQGPGSVTASDCGCGAGTYVQVLDGKYQCIGCPEGMECAGFGGDILVKEGYFSEVIPAVPSLGVWLCKSDAVCVGQENPSDVLCAKYSTGLNCGVCEPGSHRIANGTCEACQGGGRAVFLIFFVIFFGCCGLFHYVFNHRSNNSATQRRKQTMFASVSIAVTVCFVQQVGILERLSFHWPTASNSIMNGCKLLLFDFGALQLNCFVDESFSQSYLTGLAAPLVCILVIFLWLLISRILNRVSKFPKFTFPDVLNSCGMFLQGLYISVVSVTVALFQCYESGPEKQRALTKFSWETCYDSAWMSMLPIGIIAILVYVLGFFALVNFLIVVAPKHWGNVGFRRATRFLVLKFRTDTWWYGTPFLIRSLCLAMVVVVAPDDAYVQFFLMVFILLVAIVAHLYVQPYAELVANRLETFALCTLLIFLTFGVWFIEDRDYEGTEKNTARTLSILMCVCFFACAAGLLSALSYAIYMTVFPEKVVTEQEANLERVKKEYLSISDDFMSLDGVSQSTAMRELTYVDLMRLEQVTSFLQIILNDRKRSWFSKDSRLSNPAITRQLSRSDSSIDSGEKISKQIDRTQDAAATPSQLCAVTAEPEEQTTKTELVQMRGAIEELKLTLQEHLKTKEDRVPLPTWCAPDDNTLQETPHDLGSGERDPDTNKDICKEKVLAFF